MRLPLPLLLLPTLAAAAEPSYSGHGAASISPSQLAKYAPRPYPSEVTRPIQGLLDLRSPGGGILAPDGKSLFFSWNVTGITQVWRVDGPDRFPVQLSGGEDATLVSAITPDGKWLVLSRDRKGEENPGLYLQRPSGGPLELVQHRPGVQTSLQFVSDDSRYLYYRSNDVKPSSYALYRYDLNTRKSERIFDKDGIWHIADHLPGGKLLLQRSTGSLTSEIWELDDKGQLTPILGQDEKEEYQARYGARPDEILIETPKLGNFRRLYRRAKGKLEPLTPELKHDVSGFHIDEARRRIYYTVNEDGYTRLHILDAKSGEEQKLPPFTDAIHVTPGSISRDGRYAVISVETPRALRSASVYDWKTKKLTQWVKPSAPEMDLSKLTVDQLESYPARDGTPIPMFVRRPAACQGAGSCPIVVHLHGGPESQTHPGFSPLAELLAGAGYVVVQPNVRGSDGYGKAWLAADDGPKRLEVITDIEDCARYLRAQAQKGGKAPKIGVIGGSYGGYSTLVAMTRFAGAYDAGVAIVGMSNLVTFLENTAPYRRILRISEYGDPVKDRAALLELSAVSHLDKIKAPLLIIQGASDPRVPVGEALQIHDALEKRKIPSPLIIFPDEGHGAQKRDNRVTEYAATLEFFDKHLK